MDDTSSITVLDWERVKIINNKAERFLAEYFKSKSRFVMDLSFKEKEIVIIYSFNGECKCQFSMLEFLKLVNGTFKSESLKDTMITANGKGLGFAFIFERKGKDDGQE